MLCCIGDFGWNQRGSLASQLYLLEVVWIKPAIKGRDFGGKIKGTPVSEREQRPGRGKDLVVEKLFFHLDIGLIWKERAS